jgi:hypothetical protein
LTFRYIYIKTEGNVYKILAGKPDRRGYFEDLGIGGRIILEWILGKYGGKVWIR